MRLITYSDVDLFLESALPVLLENEVENNLILGIALILKSNPTIYPQKYLAEIRDNGKPQTIAVCTPPHKLLLSSKDEHAIEHYKLISEDMMKSYNISGVLANKNIALNFAEVWQSITDGVYKPGMSERIYKLENVSFPPKTRGAMRIADEKDLEMIYEWFEAFRQEAVPDHPLQNIVVMLRRKVKQREIAFWETEAPVSLISKAHSTLNGICVNMVYTPPEQRGKGYASNLVAAFSQSLLDEGWKFCTLFTDLSNPISNSIYQKIGYKPVCDFQEYMFDK